MCYDSLMNYLAALLLLLEMAQSLAAPAVPSALGVYYLQDDKTWISFPKATFSETRANGLDLFVETGGWSNLGMESACPGARSLARISSPRPIFYVREVVAPDKIMLIQLTRKKNSRIFHKSTAHITVENAEGFPKEEIRKVAVANDSHGILTVTPAADLKPGEFLLVLGNTTLSFDFGIDRKK